MGSKTGVLVSILFAIILLVSSDVMARDLVVDSTEEIRGH